MQILQIYFSLLTADSRCNQSSIKVFILKELLKSLIELLDIIKILIVLQTNVVLSPNSLKNNILLGHRSTMLDEVVLMSFFKAGEKVFGWMRLTFSAFFVFSLEPQHHHCLGDTCRLIIFQGLVKFLG